MKTKCNTPQKSMTKLNKPLQTNTLRVRRVCEKNNENLCFINYIWQHFIEIINSATLLVSHNIAHVKSISISMGKL